MLPLAATFPPFRFALPVMGWLDSLIPHETASNGSSLLMSATPSNGEFQTQRLPASMVAGACKPSGDNRKALTPIPVSTLHILPALRGDGCR